jgi:hypothetical protein
LCSDTLPANAEAMVSLRQVWVGRAHESAVVGEGVKHRVTPLPVSPPFFVIVIGGCRLKVPDPFIVIVNQFVGKQVAELPCRECLAFVETKPLHDVLRNHGV